MAPHSESIERRAESTHDVTAAVDEIEGRRHLVIADLSRDGVWLAMAESETASLEDWR
ncbi:DUF7556 family protein [Natrarchaeobius halalkaliphilus]|uniref:DUF7556 family protein n=1 Tax=Natrarchaeobius halalkaliphilus TaxID=1679091 RepID=UPI001404C5EA|nr:hypothetical protein [Natrarchaeobius halalkaliphilus]